MSRQKHAFLNKKSKNKRELQYVNQSWWEEKTKSNLQKRYLNLGKTSNLQLNRKQFDEDFNFGKGVFEEVNSEKRMYGDNKDMRCLEYIRKYKIYQSDKSIEDNEYHQYSTYFLYNQNNSNKYSVKTKPVKSHNMESNSLSLMSNQLYFNIFELILLFKFKYHIDFKYFELKDDKKSIFVKAFNEFIDEKGIFYNDKIILIKEEEALTYINLIIEQMNFKTMFSIERLFSLFNHIKDKLEVVSLPEKVHYIQPSIFLSEVKFVNTEVVRKRNNQYTKIYSTPKWINYAWDIIGIINNSRKSFIFSSYSESIDCSHHICNSYSQSNISKDNDENVNKGEVNERIKGIESIEDKLKNKNYNDFLQFEKDVYLLFKQTEEYWKISKHPEHASLCVNVYKRITNQINRLKIANKIGNK